MQSNSNGQYPQPVKPADEKVGWKGCLTILYLIAMLVYTAYTTVVAGIAFTNYSKITGAFASLISNWQQPLIMDINAVAPAANCATGYSPLTVYTWPGSNAGCDCSTSTDVTTPTHNATIIKKIYVGTCNSTQILYTCTGIGATAAKSMTDYHGFVYCVKRSPDTFVSLATNLQTDGTCKALYTQCGGMTNKLNAVCVPNGAYPSSTGCPLMDIKDSSSASYSAVSGSTDFFDTYGIQDPAPISEILFNDGGVCSGQLNTFTTTGGNHLLLTKNYTVCSSFDTSFTQFKAIGVTKTQLFSDNSVTLPSQIQPIITTPTQTIYPFKRNFFGFQPQCRADVATMVSNESKVLSIKTAQTILFIVSVVVAFILGIIFTIIEICVLCKTQQVQNCQSCLNSRDYLNWAIKIIHMACLIWAVAMAAGIKSYFTNLGNKMCGDANTNSNLSNLADQINTYVYSKDLQAIIIGAIMIFIDILMIIYKCCCAKKEEPKPTNQPTDMMSMNTGSPGGFSNPTTSPLGPYPENTMLNFNKGQNMIPNYGGPANNGMGMNGQVPMQMGFGGGMGMGGQPGYPQNGMMATELTPMGPNMGMGPGALGMPMGLSPGQFNQQNPALPPGFAQPQNNNMF
jgi:hypothetical protein